MYVQNIDANPPLGLPSMFPHERQLVTNRVQVSIRQLEGRDHYVVPVVMIANEMVMAGSEGPLLYPSGETDRSATLWNGKPVVVHHPTHIGRSFAGDPEVFSSQRVGWIFNTRASNGHLAAEAWIDIERAEIVDARILQAIKAGQQLEVSTGLFTDNVNANGSHNGREYVGIARNFRPDHLALLPDSPGACSLADGCGLLRNSQSTLGLPAMM